MDVAKVCSASERSEGHTYGLEVSKEVEESSEARVKSTGEVEILTH